MNKIKQLVDEQRSLCDQVQALEDNQILLLYDQVLDALLAADSPGFWESVRLKRMQRFFAKALVHRHLELKCLQTRESGFSA